MSQLDSAVLDRAKVLEHWDQARDQESEEKVTRGDRIEFPCFEYNHGRTLTKDTARKAHDYIRVLVSVYPFQLRYAMALPLWERFEESWCETGDEAKALGAI